jgi:hypothetical protein
MNVYIFIFAFIAFGLLIWKPYLDYKERKAANENMIKILKRNDNASKL